MHVSGGRAIKQWPPERFAEVAARLADARNAVIVATGAPGDRPLVSGLQAALAPRLVIDAAPTTGCSCRRRSSLELDLLVTGDTGPMHLASAVGTPVVAVFGPSDPARYATRGPADRVVRIDLPCSPCNRIRRPPERCVGHTPDCLVGVSTDAVFDAATAVLDRSIGSRPHCPSMTDAVFSIECASGRPRRSPGGVSRCGGRGTRASDAIAWIKSLRDARVDGLRLRHRFTFRGDSLWWFAELYLHKQGAIATIFRALAALEALVERERPQAMRFVSGGGVVQGLAPQFAAARNVAYHGPRGFRRGSALTLAAMAARASGLNASALASRLRSRRVAPATRPATALAFVHRAFWRADAGDGSAEAYIGPVLTALERRCGQDASRT